MPDSDLDSAPPPESSSKEDGSASGPPSQSSPPPDSNSSPSPPPPPSSSSSDTSAPPPSLDESNSSPPPPTSSPPPPNGSSSPSSSSSPPPPPTNSPPPPNPSSSLSPPKSGNPPSSSPPPPSPSSSSSSGDSGSPPPPPTDSQSSATPPPPLPLPEDSSRSPSPPPPTFQSPPSPTKDLSPPIISGTPSDAFPPTNPSSSKDSPSDQITPIRPSRSTPSDSTPSNGASDRAPPSRHADSSSSRQSSSVGSSDSSSTSGNGVVVGLTVAGVVVVLVAAFIVFSRKKRKRSDGLATHYIPPNSSSVRSDGYYYRHAATGGGSSHSESYYASKPPTSFVSGNTPESYRGHGYHSEQLDPGGSKSWFSYEELTDITNGFSRENLLGEGGFGCVYKGSLPDGRPVAVKELKAGSGQGEREFRAEVEIISRVHHRHLVSLVGYCIAEYHRLLVYEFVSNNTLEHHLHGKGPSVLDWPKRLKIAIGSARGLAYLHEDCHPRIIHRDIKSANILLEDSFEAQVADFGLAKLSNDTHTHVSTRVMGTFGYMAPEYASSGKLTDRSDVFSFGVMLLELITGRKPVDPSQPLGDESLVEWARPRLVHALETGNYDELVDARLENNFVRSEMFRMVEAAAACVRHSAPKRPRMVQVVRSLDTVEGDMSDLSNGVKFGQSTVFDSVQYSADIHKFRKMALGSEEYSSEYSHSGELDGRSSAYSGEFRSRGGSGAPRPPPLHQWRPGEYSSGEFPTDHESETRPMNR